MKRALYIDDDGNPRWKPDPFSPSNNKQRTQLMASLHDLPGGGGPTIKHDNVGDIITGRVLSLRSVNTTDMKTQAAITVPVITIEVNGEERSLWVNKGALGDAIKKAARAAGVNDLEGCTLTVKREADGVQKKAGFAAPHQFKAKIEKAVDDNTNDPF